MTMRLTVAASVCTVRSDIAPTRWSTGRNIEAKAGSPSQPSDSDATVMPS